MAKSPILTWLDNLINPLNSRIQRDIETLRKELEVHREELIPLRQEERDLLSSQFVPMTGKKRRRRGPTEGFFSTIYHEPVIAWHYKAYHDAAKHALLIARSQRQEYVFRIKNENTELFIGPYLVGVLTSSGRLISSKKRETLAQYGVRNNSYQPIIVYGKDAGALILPAESQAPMPRAFGFLNEMTDIEWDLFLALALVEMVRWKVG